MFYMLNFSYFFCASLQTQKEMIFFVHIFIYIYIKEKNVYVKLYTSNPVNVMCAYVYIRILKKCSGWFRYTDFRKFCAGLFAYFSLREAAALRAKCICLYVQKRKQNVYVYIHKKKNKMHMFTYTKFEAICIALRIHKKSCRQNAGSRDAYVYMRTFFSPRTNSSGQTSGQKIKKCIHYIYTKYPFFMFKKCIHYIYTRNHTSSRQQPFQRLHHYSPTPQTCQQQAEI